MANRDFSKIERIMKDFSANVGEGSPIEEGTGIKITGEDTKVISIDEEVVAKKTDIGNGKITITQGGTTKGSFNVNQKNGTTIELDGGGNADVVQVRTLGSILLEGFNKVMATGIVNYEGIRDLVKQHLDDIGLSEDCYLTILPMILDKNDLYTPRGLLCIHYSQNPCNGYYYIEIITDGVYGSLSGQTNLEIENDLGSLYDLVDYLYENSINTEVTVKGSSGSVTALQNNTLCSNLIRYEVSMDGGQGYSSSPSTESPIGTYSIISEVFTTSGS